MIYPELGLLEVWKPIDNYEGIYEVSNLGRVKSLARRVPSSRYSKGYKNVKAKILKGGPSSFGYAKVELCRDGINKKIPVHRLVALHFLDPKPVGCVVNHIDGNKMNNIVSNLELITSKENNEHAYITGLRDTKLTKDNVIQLRNLYSLGFTTHALASMFNVTQANIWNVVNNKTWKHLNEGVSKS